MKTLLSVLVSVLCAAPLFGQVYDLNRPEYWKSKQIEAVPAGQGTVFSIRGETWPTAAGIELMEIDPARTYVFSAEIRTAAGKPGLAELGFWLFDGNRKPIRYVRIGGFPATDTVLAEPCSKGDRRIKVQSARQFRRGGGAIAFGVKAGIRQEPWPESDLVSGIGKISRSGSCDIIELKNPVKKDYPAGTGSGSSSRRPISIAGGAGLRPNGLRSRAGLPASPPIMPRKENGGRPPNSSGSGSPRTSQPGRMPSRKSAISNWKLLSRHISDRLKSNISIFIWIFFGFY